MRTVALYGRADMLVLALCAAAVQEAGAEPAVRADKFFATDAGQFEAFDAVIAVEGRQATPSIAESYTARGTPTFVLPDGHSQEELQLELQASAPFQQLLEFLFGRAEDEALESIPTDAEGSETGGDEPAADAPASCEPASTSDSSSPAAEGAGAPSADTPQAPSPTPDSTTAPSTAPVSRRRGGR